MPKLFIALSPTFSPTPHSGSEYGDVSIPIHVRGTRKTFIGLSKTGRTTKTVNGIEKPNKTAEDWVAQILRQAIRDQAVETFGLISPVPVNQEFHDSIVLLAKMDNKPFVVFGKEELTRMLCTMLQQPNHSALLGLL